MEFDYEVGLLPPDKMRKFIIWYDDKIGTEYDLTEHDEELSFFVAFSITYAEMGMIERKFATLGGMTINEYEEKQKQFEEAIL